MRVSVALSSLLWGLGGAFLCVRFVDARVVVLRGDMVPVSCGVWGAWCFRCVAVFRVGAVVPRLFGAGVAHVFVSVRLRGVRWVFVLPRGRALCVFVGWLSFCDTVVIV